MVKVILVKHFPIKSKTGAFWDKMLCLTQKGKICEPFMSREQYLATGLNESDFLSESEINEIFAKYKSFDISFDETGRFESLNS